MFADEAHEDLQGQIALAAFLGVGWIELRIVDGLNVTTLSEEQTRIVAGRLREAGIGVSAVASPIGKSPLSEPLKPVLERLGHVCRQAGILGTRNVRVFSFYPDGDEATVEERVFGRFERMTEVARTYGVRLLLENESAVYGHSARNCAALGARFGGENLALVYDPGNFVWGEGITDGIQTCWPMMRPYVEHVHLKDWTAGHTRAGTLPGDGDGCIPELLSALSDEGYDGFLTLEPHLSGGGRFGGTTSGEQFALACGRVRDYLDKLEMKYI